MSAQPERLLILAEGFSGDPHYGKTARGVLAYGERPVVALLDSTRAGETQNGVPVVAAVNDALCFNPTTALVGVATQGGRFPPAWRELLEDAISKGLHVENGLHEFLADDDELVGLAARHGVELRDLRRPPADLNVPTGANLELPVKTVLTVGSDCAIGKMTVSLELDRAARARDSRRASSRPDRRASRLPAGESPSTQSSPTSSPARRSGWSSRARAWGRLLLVEGQGALLHPAYSGVTLGLVHGSAPHAFVLCHLAGQTEIEGYPGHPLTPLPEIVALHENLAARAKGDGGRGRAQHA